MSYSIIMVIYFSMLGRAFYVYDIKFIYIYVITVETFIS